MKRNDTIKYVPRLLTAYCVLHSPCEQHRIPVKSSGLCVLVALRTQHNCQVPHYQQL